MRFNVGQSNADKVVQEVLLRVEQPSLVDGPLGEAGVEGVVAHRFRAPCPPPELCLDLIAHSRAGVLYLGGWAVDGNDATHTLQTSCAAMFERMPLRDIRLLGCNTAVKPGGRRAMRSLATIFGARVWGTKVPISANDFDRDGFRSSGLLADLDDIAQFAAGSLSSTSRWFTGLGVRRVGPCDLAGELLDEAEAEALEDWMRAAPASRWPVLRCDRRELEGLLDHAQPGMARVPGILALPDLEILAPARTSGDQARYHRLTVLLDHELIRIYTCQIPRGCVFRVRRSPAWHAALQQGRVIHS